MQGSRIGVDREGFIRRAADGATVGAPYQPVVDTLRESWYRRSGLPIHGLYLVGSVAAGQARPFFSDLDVTLLLTEPPTDEHRQIG
jgi:predicted nucleotidyltransferase